MRIFFVLLSILISTTSLIVILDIVQGNDPYETWYGLNQLLLVAKGEDYFLIIVMLLILLLLSISHIRKKKK